MNMDMFSLHFKFFENIVLQDFYLPFLCWFDSSCINSADLFTIKLQYLRLVRTLKFYGHMHFRPCITDYPDPNTLVLLAVGNKELNFRIQTGKVSWYLQIIMTTLNEQLFLFHIDLLYWKQRNNFLKPQDCV